MEIGDRIREARKVKKISQDDLAKMVGISRVTLGFYERNENMPPSDVSARIAETLGVSLNYLLTGGGTLSELFEANSRFVGASMKTMDEFLDYHGIPKDDFPYMWRDYVRLLNEYKLTHETLIHFIVSFYFEHTKEFRASNAHMCAMMTGGDPRGWIPSASIYELNSEKED